MKLETGALRGNRRLASAVLAAVLILGSVSASYPQEGSILCDYVAETGHYVCAEFLEFYENRGGVEIFGYPLTEGFDDPALGVHAQYFQRARLEWRPHNPDPYKVQLGLLADDLGYIFPPAVEEQIPPRNSTLHHFFPETEHVVSYAFLKFYRDKGGLDIFGYPRSEFMNEDGYVVQYFQRARMEWHPDAVYGPEVRLTNLGEWYVERFDVPRQYSEPQPAPSRMSLERPSGSLPQPLITKLDVSASVASAMTEEQDTQTVYVYVRDQQGQPVEGAVASIVLRFDSGDQVCTPDAPTRTNGFTECTCDVLPSARGNRVVVDVTVTYGDLTGVTQTFFLPWW